MFHAKVQPEASHRVTPGMAGRIARDAALVRFGGGARNPPVPTLRADLPRVWRLQVAHEAA